MKKRKTEQVTGEKHQHSMNYLSTSPRISPDFWLKYIAETDFLWKTANEVLESVLFSEQKFTRML